MVVVVVVRLEHSHSFIDSLDMCMSPLLSDLFACMYAYTRSVSYVENPFTYTTTRAVCKWVFTNMSFSSRAGAIRQRLSPKSQVIFAFVFL